MHLKNASARKILSSDSEFHSGNNDLIENLGGKVSQKIKSVESKKSKKANDINSESIILEKLLSYSRAEHATSSESFERIMHTKHKCKNLISMKICGFTKHSPQDLHGHLAEIQKLSSPIYSLVDDIDIDGNTFESLIHRPLKSG